MDYLSLAVHIMPLRRGSSFNCGIFLSQVSQVPKECVVTALLARLDSLATKETKEVQDGQVYGSCIYIYLLYHLIKFFALH